MRRALLPGGHPHRARPGRHVRARSSPGPNGVRAVRDHDGRPAVVPRRSGGLPEVPRRRRVWCSSRTRRSTCPTGSPTRATDDERAADLPLRRGRVARAGRAGHRSRRRGRGGPRRARRASYLAQGDAGFYTQVVQLPAGIRGAGAQPRPRRGVHGARGQLRVRRRADGALRPHRGRGQRRRTGSPPGPTGCRSSSCARARPRSRWPTA